MQDIEQAANTTAPEKDNASNAASIGKFESSEALLKAYNNLEAEFTRKSQQLKELNKPRGKTSDTNDSPEPQKTESALVEEGAVSAPTEVPLYERAEWSERLDEFLNANPAGKQYAREIASVLIKDTALAKDKRCLELALSRVLQEKLANPVDILKDDKIRGYVLSDEGIKSEIIKEYIESLSSFVPPRPITRGGEIAAAPLRKITTLEEAGKMTAELIKNRRN